MLPMFTSFLFPGVSDRWVDFFKVESTERGLSTEDHFESRDFILSLLCLGVILTLRADRFLLEDREFELLRADSWSCLAELFLETC